MSRPCPVPSCTRTMPGHHTVCRACSTELLRDLRDVPSLARHLEEAATRQVRLGTPGGGPADREQPVPWDERARTAQHTLRTTLVGWVRALQPGGPRTLAGPTCTTCSHRTCTYMTLFEAPADTLAAMAVWLIRHRAVLLGRHSAPEAVDGIREAIHHVRRTIDRPADRIYAGPCNTCGADLLAKPGASTIACRPCTMVYDIGPRLEWMRKETENLLGSASWVATVATSLGHPVTASAVRGLARRGRVTAKGRDAMGYPTYRVGDVLDIVTSRAV